MSGGDRRRVQIDDAQAGQRLDRVLAVALEDLSRARIQDLIRQGSVCSAGRTLSDPAARVKPGDVVEVEVPRAVPAEPEGEAIPLAVVFEDDQLIVLDKPAGLVVHPAVGHRTGTLVNALIAHCGDSLSGVGGVRRPGIVHRLDKDTSGLLVVAKTDKAHQGLAAQFASHGADGQLERRYRAFVWGGMQRPSGRIDLPLGRSPSNRVKIAVVASGRRAVTHWTLRAEFGVSSHVLVSDLAVSLETGRTHQIRVHMAHRGHPLLGDTTYGSSHKASLARLGPRSQAALLALGRQALHAELLGFVHPTSGQRLRFESALPADLAALETALLDEHGNNAP
jgi:23S rRNA pseudouridine1911/1915/1917 synthase